MRIAAARNYRFFHAPTVARASVIIRIVYYNNYATYLQIVSRRNWRYEALTTVFQIPGCGTAALERVHSREIFPSVHQEASVIGSRTVIWRNHFRHFVRRSMRRACCAGMTRKIVHSGSRTSAAWYGSDVHKGGDVSHGIIAPSRDYPPGSRVKPRSLAWFAAS